MGVRSDPAARGRRRPRSVLAGVVALAVVLALPTGVASFGPAPHLGPTSGAGASVRGAASLAHGLAGYSSVQTVAATPYWETYCAPSDPDSPCTDPVGLAYVAPDNALVLTETNWTGGLALPGIEAPAVAEFNATSLQPLGRLDLNCTPGLPLYPGSGPNVYVPCSNQSILVVRAAGDELVATVALPFWISATTFDPQTDSLIAAGWNTSGSPMLGEVDLTTLDVTRVLVTPMAAVAGGGDAGDGYLLAFDPSIDALLLPNISARFSGYSLVALSAPDGANRSFVPIGAPILSITDVPQTNEVLVTTGGPFFVEVLDASTLAVEARIALPSCLPGACAAGDAEAVLVDPLHGDAYLLTSLALDVLNLTTLSIVATVFDYGDGRQGSGAYVPGADRIYGAYNLIAQPLPGFMIQLQHGSYSVLTTLLWLPTSLAILAVGASVAAVVGVLRFRGPKVPPRTARTASNSDPDRPLPPELQAWAAWGRLGSVLPPDARELERPPARGRS